MPFPTCLQQYAAWHSVMAQSSSGRRWPCRATRSRCPTSPATREPAWGNNHNSVGVIIEDGACSASLTGDAEPRLFDGWIDAVHEQLRDVHVHEASPASSSVARRNRARTAASGCG